MMRAEEGRRLWHQLHSFADGSKDIHDQEFFFSYWLSEVGAAIGCVTCFKKIKHFIAKWPVEYGEGFRLWSFCLHDYVNKELGRKLFYPELTVAPLTDKGILQ